MTLHQKIERLNASKDYFRENLQTQGLSKKILESLIKQGRRHKTIQFN